MRQGARTADPQLDKADGPARPEAAIALGGIGGRPALARLIALLSDHDPFVRFNAYRALRTLANADHFADWIFGEARSHVRAIRGWKTWLANRKQ